MAGAIRPSTRIDLVADDPFLLKDLFNRESVGEVAGAVQAAQPAFDPRAFLAEVFDGRWDSLELKQRMRRVAEVLHRHLPGGYRSQLEILLAAVPHTPAGFPAMAYSDFVEAYGADDWDASVPALERFTTLVSAEFAIRPFIASDPERTLARMLEWACDPDPAVRRLASEGCRPRLPWGMRLRALIADPRPVLPILERLRDDPDEAVRRSVANNLNDIAKDHPELVVETLRVWNETPSEHTPGLLRHALRTLLKKGDPEAMELLGFPRHPRVEVEALLVEPGRVPIGGSARLSFTLVSTGARPQQLMVDYLIHFVKANGSTSPKVFKLTTLELGPGERIELGRKLSFVQMSTRTHYPGPHRLEVQVNGEIRGSVDIRLESGP